MTHNWLYPLSRNSGFYFDVGGEEMPDTCFGCFVHMHNTKRTDDTWFLRRHAGDIGPGDRIWPYYGTAEGDRGIVGLAEAREVVHVNGEPNVRLRWKRVTARLILQPFDAKRVRLYIPYPRAAVVDMDRFPQLVGAIDHHIDWISKKN